MKPIKKQTWNNVDAIGLINGISTWDDNFLNLKYVRIPGETNIELRHKINAFADNNNPLYGSIEQQLIIGLANELGLDSYNIMNQTTFNLSRPPFPVGNKREQDIFLYYQEPGLDTWTEITPQYWSEDVEHTIPTSGFIVWENSYFAQSTTSSKTNNYSRLLQIYSVIPNNSRLKVIYSIQKIDSDNNKYTVKFTDMDNVNNPESRDFLYYKSDEVTIPDLNIKPIVYSLGEIPPAYSGVYYNPDGTATSKLFKLRDKIDSVYRHRWKNIADRKTIWDINLNFSKGTIPSFYDTAFETTSGVYEVVMSNLTGELGYYNPALYIKDIDIVQDNANNKEYWYPVLQPGPLYIDGRNYYLMENPKGVFINLFSGTTVLPSGIKVYHKVILNTSQVFPVTENLQQDVDYTVEFKDYDLNISSEIKLNSSIARKRSYLNNDMGFQTILDTNEYMIDYMSGVIYSNGLTNGVLYWDDVLVPDKVTISGEVADLNPLNDTSLGYDEYFMVIG